MKVNTAKSRDLRKALRLRKSRRISIFSINSLRSGGVEWKAPEQDWWYVNLHKSCFTTTRLFAPSRRLKFVCWLKRKAGENIWNGFTSRELREFESWKEEKWVNEQLIIREAKRFSGDLFHRLSINFNQLRGMQEILFEICEHFYQTPGEVNDIGSCLIKTTRSISNFPLWVIRRFKSIFA